MESQAGVSKKPPSGDELGRELLYSLVEKLLANTTSVPEFRNEYYNLYLEGVSDDALSDRESELLGLLQEILDWADPETRCGEPAVRVDRRKTVPILGS